MHRDDDRRLAESDRRLDLTLDRLMVGPVIMLDPGLDLLMLEADIPRHDEPVGDLHDERRVVEAAIGVDQEARELGEDRRRAERLGQTLRHGGGAEIVGDMAVQILRFEAQRAVGLGDGVLGVVAEDKEASARLLFDAAIGLGAQVFLPKSIQTSLRAAVPRVTLTCAPSPSRARKKLGGGPGCNALPMIFGGSFAGADRLYNWATG